MILNGERFFISRYMIKTIMPGEIASDDRLQDGEQAFKTAVFIHSLDTLFIQLKDRFSDENVDIMLAMHYFSPSFLLSDSPDITAAAIEPLTAFYSLDTAILVRELQEFRPVYKSVHHVINVDDLMSKQPNINIDSNLSDEDDSNEINDDANRKRNWANFGFVKPLRALMDLSGFPLLTWMYKILVTLAITSSSAERSMSRVRIIKNRLRTTMLDDWFSSLMIIAAEKDIVNKIPVDCIIDQFAISSKPLQKLLLFNNADNGGKQ